MFQLKLGRLLFIYLHFTRLSLILIFLLNRRFMLICFRLNLSLIHLFQSFSLIFYLFVGKSLRFSTSLRADVANCLRWIINVFFWSSFRILMFLWGCLSFDWFSYTHHLWLSPWLSRDVRYNASFLPFTDFTLPILVKTYSLAFLFELIVRIFVIWLRLIHLSLIGCFNNTRILDLGFHLKSFQSVLRLFWDFINRMFYSMIVYCTLLWRTFRSIRTDIRIVFHFVYFSLTVFFSLNLFRLTIFLLVHLSKFFLVNYLDFINCALV